MKIAQIAPLIERVPPIKYGGTERVVHEITEELVKRGHDVTLFASGDSITAAKLVSVYPKSLRESRAVTDLYESNALSMLNIGAAYQSQDKFDIIHDHSGYLGLPSANIARKPVVMTCHGPFNPEVTKIYQMLRNPAVVSISKAQVRGIYGINLVGNVYNGLTMDHYPFSETHDGYLLFVGRISLEKGVHYAVQTAIHLNLPLIIAAKLEISDMPYFNEYIAPRLSDSISWIGEVNEEKRNLLMSRAMCFLHPVTWKEPFGLTMIESMACGCPVIAMNRGSIPEIIVKGKTGFVVSDIQGMVEAVKKIKLINRSECRQYVLSHFNAGIMVDEYEKIYLKIINKKNGKFNF